MSWYTPLQHYTNISAIFAISSVVEWGVNLLVVAKCFSHDFVIIQMSTFCKNLIEGGLSVIEGTQFVHNCLKLSVLQAFRISWNSQCAILINLSTVLNIYSLHCYENKPNRFCEKQQIHVAIYRLFFTNTCSYIQSIFYKYM